MRDTITESELAVWVLGTEMAAASHGLGNALRESLPALGITVVPDPIPEPEGDVIAIDRDGSPWERGEDLAWSWGGRERTWPALVEDFGPVKIYRLEESV